MYRRSLIATIVVGLFAGAPTSGSGQSARPEDSRDAAAFRRLQAQTGGRAAIGLNSATRGARFIRLQPGAPGGLAPGRAVTMAEKQQRSQAFFRDYASLLGVQDAAMLRFDSATTDQVGETHLTWRQFYGTVPVFAGVVKTHFDRTQQLKAVTGTTVPDIGVTPTPSVARARAIDVALAQVADAGREAAAVRAGTTTLYVYREGLAQGIPGESRLAWEVEITNGVSVRELFYVDAHTGKVIDRVTGIQDDLRRRAYDGHDLAMVPQNYPNGVYWQEGQPFPTASTEANNMIVASKETYDFFSKSFGRDSYDTKGGVMDAIFDRGYSCPNASWNGVFISFCPGFTTDDVTAHEWGHAYTQYTHGLIYQWQPGALNEAYSDIYGEIIDRINNRGLDTPNLSRSPNACSAFSPPVPRVVVNDPASLGTLLATPAVFGPQLNTTGVTADVAAALDAANPAGPSTLDACTPLTNAAAVAGKIALVDRGGCTFVIKAATVQAAGAIGLIVANNTVGLLTLGGDAPNVTIPSVMIQRTDGVTLRAALTANTVVNATLLAQPGSDDSYRWLMGEEIADGGALRDMWNANCYANPRKVRDPFYFCGVEDSGGVHFNSGIPNHAFALLTDGGSYNDQTIAAIGLTKAAHIYYRAASVYQVPQSDFADHADALEQSCTDLVGQPLNALTGGPSSEVISAADCTQVANAIAAVELRTPPPCAFAPLLTQGLPALCGTGTTGAAGLLAIVSENFEAEPAGWSAVSVPASTLFTERNWTRVSGLPGSRAGSAFFAPDPDTACPTVEEPSDESGVLQLTSPEIVLPAGAAFPRATFEHWVATEPGWDGGNLKVSVNGGPWQLIPPSSYTFNGHNAQLFLAEQGNTNPLAGQTAWSGNDNGTVNGGTWGRTHVNLAGFARAGDRIRLRWDFGTDLCAGRTGWYVDNVNVFSCTPNVPVVSAADISVAEGNAGKRDVFFTVRLSTPTVLPVTVNYSIADGTALHGDDFLPVEDGTLVIPPGAIGVQVAITLKGDTTVEGNEVFFLNLSGAVNATLSDPQAQATIVNDDTPPGQ